MLERTAPKALQDYTEYSQSKNFFIVNSWEEEIIKIYTSLVMTVFLAPLPTSTQAKAPTDTGVLVVFKREGTSFSYSGTANNVSLPQMILNKSSLSLKDKKPEKIDIPKHAVYLCYFASNNASSTFYYSPSLKQIQSRTGSFFPLSATENTQVMRSVNHAKPIKTQIRTNTVNGMYPDPLPALKFMCMEAHYILTGRVVGVLREGNTPLNDPLSDSKHTVFLVAVERYFKAVPNYQPEVIKVVQVGAWSVLTPGDPLLNMGVRYLLFLKVPYLRLLSFQRSNKGYYSANAGHGEGVGAYYDEMALLHPLNSQLILSKGTTKSPENAMPNWQFRMGEQINDVTENQAQDAIISTLKSLK